jgi:hypothetical protein
MDALNLVSYFQETEDGILCAQEYFFLNMFTHYRYLFFSDYMEDLFNTLLAIFSLFSNFYVATEDDPFYELFFFFDCEFFEEFVSFANANEVYDFWQMDSTYDESEWLNQDSEFNSYLWNDYESSHVEFMDDLLGDLTLDYLDFFEDLYDQLFYFDRLFFSDHPEQSYLESYAVYEKMGFASEDDFSKQDLYPVFTEFKDLQFGFLFPQTEDWSLYRFKILDLFQRGFFMPQNFILDNKSTNLYFEDFLNNFMVSNDKFSLTDNFISLHNNFFRSFLSTNNNFFDSKNSFFFDVYSRIWWQNISKDLSKLDNILFSFYIWMSIMVIFSFIPI